MADTVIFYRLQLIANAVLIYADSVQNAELRRVNMDSSTVFSSSVGFTKYITNTMKVKFGHQQSDRQTPEK